MASSYSYDLPGVLGFFPSTTKQLTQFSEDTDSVSQNSTNSDSIYPETASDPTD